MNQLAMPVVAVGERQYGPAEDMLQLVTFRVGSEEFALDIQLVQEINRMVEITTVPKAPECVEGVINLRGKIVPVLDLRKRFGLPGREFNGHSRIIVVTIDHRILGLMVDAVSEVLRIPAHILQPPPPPLVPGVDASYIKAVGKIEDRLLIVLDLAKVVSAKETGIV